MGTDTLAANKEVVRRLYQEFFTHGRLELADELMSVDYLNHDPPAGSDPTREDVTATAARLREQLGNLADDRSHHRRR